MQSRQSLSGEVADRTVSFVSTYMEKNVTALICENIGKNLADADEYPALMTMHSRCVSIIADLWGANKNENAIGSATVGSSEAIMLGGKAMQRRWQEKRRKLGKDASKPNIIMGANAQVALEKFARYFDVEARILDVSRKSNYCLDPGKLRRNIDENTIGVFVILGSTYTGHFEPVEEISKILDKYEADTGHDIPIHVDAASGGFVCPFTHAGAGQKWFAMCSPRCYIRIVCLGVFQELRAPARQVHQCLRPQVRAGVSRRWLDHLERSVVFAH